MSNRPRPDLKEVRKAEGEERLKRWRALSPVEQLEALDRRLDLGWAWKQRKRIIDAACPSKDKNVLCTDKSCTVHRRG